MWSVALEAALQTYPHATFLLHSGSPNVFHLRILPLLPDYPNVYHAFDSNHLFTEGGVPPYSIPDRPEATKQFVSDCSQVGRRD